jgi:hypothetical protein
MVQRKTSGKKTAALDAVFGAILLLEFVWVSYGFYYDVTHDEKAVMGGKINSPQLFGLCGAFVIVCVFGIKAGVKAAFGLLSRTLLSSSFLPKAQRHPLRSPIQMKKFQDQAWQFAIHASMSYFAYRLVSRTNWWHDPASAYQPCPQDYEPSDEMILFYTLQLAIWSWTALSCYFLEERRKDYLEMMIHHVVTIALVTTSRHQGNFSTGTLVLLVHDGSDIVLDLMKMANYLKLEGLRCGFAVEALFVANTYISWPFLRLYYFPFIIVYKGWLEGFTSNCTLTSNHTFIASGFLALTILHVFWFGLLQRLAFKVLFSGKKPQEAGEEEYEGKED